MVDDAFDFSAVDAEFAGNGPLTVTRVVPGPYRLHHVRCRRQRGRCAAVRDRQQEAHLGLRRWHRAGYSPGPDEGHKELERARQRQCWPGADQCADGAVAKTVCQVGAGGGQDACAQAPACQWWCGLVVSAGVEEEHAAGQDEPVDGEGQKSGGQPGLAVGTDEFVRMAVADHRCHRGDGRHGEGGGDPDQPVCQRGRRWCWPC